MFIQAYVSKVFFKMIKVEGIPCARSNLFPIINNLYFLRLISH